MDVHGQTNQNLSPMNNLLEQNIELDPAISDLKNENSSIGETREGKRKRVCDQTEDSLNEVKFRPKKVKLLSPRLIKELSKLHENEQSQVYFSTWLTKFPTVRLKMVTNDTKGNCEREYNEISNNLNLKTCGAALKIKETTSGTPSSEGNKMLLIKRRSLHDVNCKENQNIDVLKSPSKKTSQPFVLLEKIDADLCNRLEIENIDDQHKDGNDGTNVDVENEINSQCENNKQPAALTELQLAQRFPKPVVRLKLLDENEINRLKHSLLNNDKNSCTAMSVTPKLSIFSSMTPVIRLRKIMEDIDLNHKIDRPHTETQKEIKYNTENELKGETENSLKEETENLVKRGRGRPPKCIKPKDKNLDLKTVKVKRVRRRTSKCIESEDEICNSETEKIKTKMRRGRASLAGVIKVPVSLPNRKIVIPTNSVRMARKLIKTAKQCDKEEKRKGLPIKAIQVSFKRRTVKSTVSTEKLSNSLQKLVKVQKAVKPRQLENTSEGETKSSKTKTSTTITSNNNMSSVKKPKKRTGNITKKKLRCKKCENCLRPNCGTCNFCLDMKKFGGQNILKQCCMNRKCLFRNYHVIKNEKSQPHSFVLTPKLEELLKSGETFLQDRPCWNLPDKLNKCHQCAVDFKDGSFEEILCRFYLFRRLAFAEDGVLKCVGFEETGASIDDDRKLLMPFAVEPANLDVDTSKYILKYVGEHFCDLVEQEKHIRNRFSTEKVVLKRTVQGIREMCDVCDTTIFNYHFSCDTCGFGVCIDCYDGNQFLWMACVRDTVHIKEKLMVTQIIPGDILWELNDLAHSTCEQNEVFTNCACVNKENNEDGKKNNVVCKQLMEEIKQHYNEKEEQNGESPNDVGFSNNNEFQLESDSASGKNEVDRKPLSALQTIINSVVSQYFCGASFDEKRLQFLMDRYPGGKNEGNEHAFRIFTMTESQLIFPDIPHAWLCEGRLLWLREPHHPKNVPLFQEIWKRGQPILISDVHKHLDDDLWQPKAFSRDFGEVKNDLIDCLSGAVLHDEPMKHFWDGFEDPKKRLKNKDGYPRLLKLKDWPPGDDFSEILPTRFEDLMKALPLPDYTHRDGKLNLTARLPSYFVPPDLGPKMYIAYGSTGYPSQGTTNLHLDMSDAVNVMVYAGILEDKTENDLIKETYQAVCEAGCDILARRRVQQEGVLVGAVWHIFKARDTPKIRTLLNALIVESGGEIEPNSDPIHDQRFYLDSHLRERLSSEYGVEGCAIAQCVGDAVFIPAGAPHQVQNLRSCIKVAEDFVTPENIGHCLMLTQEFRYLSNSHTNHEDKLQVKNIAYHAMKDSLSVIMANQKKMNEDD